MERKEFLKLAGTAAAGSLLARCSPAPEAWNGATGETRITVKIFELKLKQAWGLSRGTWTTRRNAFVRIERDGVIGLGEAAPIARYSETAESAAAFIEKARPVLLKDLREYAVRFGEIEALGPGEHAAKAALDMAVLDWVGRKLGEPVWRLLGLGRDKVVTTTYSIGIDEVPVMQQKVRDAPDFGVYKIKVGTADDRKIVEGIRAVTDKPLITDANEGWKTKEEALEMIDWMADQGVELVEQPLPADRLEDQGWLKERVKIPIFADECLIRPSDLPRIAAVLPRRQRQGHEVRRAPGGRAPGRHGPGPGLEAHDRLHDRELARHLGLGGRGLALRPGRPRREHPHLERSVPGRQDGQGRARPRRRAGARRHGRSALGTDGTAAGGGT